MRVGLGYDVHPLVEGRKLILGGVDIPFERGLAGHSDGDVLVHAIMDALLGAAALGDIGTHFPTTDSKYKDISSVILLGEVDKKLRSAGWQVVNIDATIAAEQPRLAPFVRQMQDNIGQALQIQSDLVSIKATTTEGLGFTGRGEGIAAYAVALIQKAD
jgi:2-C-methyl-D-erythritol 2,4-cyclodiphosphate synthase